MNRGYFKPLLQFSLSHAKLAVSLEQYEEYPWVNAEIQFTIKIVLLTGQAWNLSTLEYTAVMRLKHNELRVSYKFCLKMAIIC